MHVWFPDLAMNLETLVKDKELASRRVKISAMLQEFPRLVGDIFTMEMQEQVIEQGFNPYIFTEANPWHVNESVEWPQYYQD